MGSTGSGKSTLVSLIPRFYDVTGGSVLVDGVDVREMAQQDLWRRIGLVPQKSFLFSGTVASNLRHGDEQAADDELWRLLGIAQGREFVADMPEQLEAPVAQGGANVSGGQRQRLAIARALAKKAKIHIFDDSFSALDFTTDSRLRAALRRETADATVIIVAQRVGTIMHADRIVVLEDGTIAGIGTHDELLQLQRDLPRDRRLPARRGGGGMSTRTGAGDAGRRRPGEPAGRTRPVREAPAAAPARRAIRSSCPSPRRATSRDR